MLGNFSSSTFDQICKEIPAKSQCSSKIFMVLVSCDFSLFYHRGRDMGVAGVNWLLNGLERPLSANFRSLVFFFLFRIHCFSQSVPDIICRYCLLSISTSCFGLLSLVAELFLTTDFYLMSERSERMRYQVEHEKIKFISISEYVISSI